MKLTRRNFVRAMGVTGITLATGLKAETRVPGPEPTEFCGMLFDASMCIGCRTCERTCAKVHGLPESEDEIKPGIVRLTNEARRSVINSHNTSIGEVFVRTQCMHCNDPACVAACLTQAMFKTEEGPVIWREEKCMGCRYCMVSCPFDIPKFEYYSPNPVIQKCDMCYDRVVQGKIPACAEACGDALIFGKRRELLAEARKRIAEDPENYSEMIYGEVTAGGTGVIYLSPVPPKELQMDMSLQNESYPALSKGFLYAVPSVFVLLPPLLLGIQKATSQRSNTAEYDE